MDWLLENEALRAQRERDERQEAEDALPWLDEEDDE